MPFPLLPIAVGAGASILGGILGNKGQQQNTSTNSTTTSTPTMDPAYAGLRGMLMKNIIGRLGQKTSLGPEFAANRIAGTNNVYDRVAAGQSDRAAAAGIGGSPASAAAGRSLDIARAGDITAGLNEIPLLEQQQDSQNLDAATRFMTTGMGTTSTTKGTGVTQQPSSTAAGIGAGLGDFSQLLGWMYGNGMFGGGKGAGASGGW